MKRVDWRQLMSDATSRLPPFSSGESEKGFRDRLIQESFLQLVVESPKTPSACRVVLVTGDGLLAESVEKACCDYKNTRILRSIDELESLINTLVSAVTESFVAAIKPEASRVFFDADLQQGLYFSGEVGALISNTFESELEDIPKGADLRENGQTLIGGPTFVTKKGQRISWRSTVEIKCKAYRREAASPVGSQSVISSGLITSRPELYGLANWRTDEPDPRKTYFVDSGMLNIHYPGLSDSTTTSAVLSPSSKKLVSAGRSEFHVTWSVTASADSKLRNPKVERVDFVGTEWGV